MVATSAPNRGNSSAAKAKRKTTYNVVMVVAIVLIAAGVILGVGMLQGWFSFGNDKVQATYPETEVVAQNKVGNVNIERSGIAYALSNGDKLRNDDVVQTLTGSSVDICYGDITETVPERCEVTIHIEPEDNKVSVEYINTPETSENGDANNADSEGNSTSTYNPSTEGLPPVDVSGNDNAATNQGSGNSGNSGASNGSGATNNSGVSNESSGNGEAASGSETSSGESQYAHTCTIQISCANILDNLSKLDAGLDRFVPANGIILATSTIGFNDGETVFDVLKRACSMAGIQLEYSWTPIYNSYYVEGINHIYEFSCGNESGWMFQVNGWYPNYGCSSYELKQGDQIVWNYTVNGYGADLGAAMR